MSTITVFPGLTAATPSAGHQVAPNTAVRFMPVEQPGLDRTRRRASTRLQALRERAAARVETMACHGDTHEELQKLAETTRGMQWAQSQTRIWQDDES